MVFQLATRYPKHIAAFFLGLFSSSFFPAYAVKDYDEQRTFSSGASKMRMIPATSFFERIANKSGKQGKQETSMTLVETRSSNTKDFQPKKESIGGPGQPEMTSFKSVGAGNMVNLFTGDFSYNIPLLDVGGYPVNIFYDGGVSMEQDASWVGLGWNINPGTISRNMRGLPDDFNGEDTMVQTQRMKPNTTWGASIGYDLELMGTKNFTKNFVGSVGASVGISVNNYLGPAIDLSIKGGTNFKLADKANSEKSTSIGAGLAANISSRNGLTLSPNFSLTTSSHLGNNSLSSGVRLGTSYNSRSGIKQLQISEQMSYNFQTEKHKGSIGSSLFSTAITFSKPSYIPALRMPVTNEAWSGHFQLGNALFGVYGSAEVEVYRQRSEIADADVIQKKPMVGYLYFQRAKDNSSAVMDFTRFNDNEVTPNTPIISAPQYAYDVFSIQGEGTGGSIRLYRNDRGFVRDNTTRSKDKNFSAGADVGIPGHYGANFNIIKTPSIISGWENGNRLRNTPGFGEANGLTENVYFRNPGESSVLSTDEFTAIGGTDLVRYKLGGINAAPTLEPVLEQFDKGNKLIATTNLLSAPIPAERKKRTQVTSFLTAEEASKIGLDTLIKTYDVDSVLTSARNLKFDTISRLGYYRKKHHISEITVTEGDGKRYVYGIPVYNVVQKDFTFTVSHTGDDVDQVEVKTAEIDSLKVSKLNAQSGKDNFLQTTETPAYAHSFLLTGLLSLDYVDVAGDGITEDDLGQAVKFNYTRIKKPGDWSNYKWQTPATTSTSLKANFNPGNLSEARDDKGLLTYGERESWYLHSLESKTMIALFTLENRKDGKSVNGELGITNVSDNSQKRLKKIDLYSKADLKKNGLNNAKPIKTVWFTYNYSLCPGVPGNSGETETQQGGTTNVNLGKGKLTLESIYFTYNGKTRTNKSEYRFYYTHKDGSGNPSYQAAASDRWGSYKPADQNPVISQSPVTQLKNAVYPYAIQSKGHADKNAGAWALKSIVLPSGGQIDVQYESDDYAFVQNRRASAMMEIVGLGDTSVLSGSNQLYTVKGLGKVENDYMFIKVPSVCASNTDVWEKYLKGQEQLALKLAVNMPKGVEYIPVYGLIDTFGFITGNPIIWVKLKRANELSPLTLAALDYLRERLPGQAFAGYDVSESSGIRQAGDMLIGMYDAVRSAFKNPVQFLRDENKAQTINLNASFVRLNVPDGYKYGGGHRVKSVTLRDNWEPMTKFNDSKGQATAVYGQQYEYTTTEIFNGKERPISSGVASYEPSIGGEENPFQSIVRVEDQLPLGPASYGAIEMPVLDAFFPAPVVGYSKVTVRSIQKGTPDPNKKSRSGVGKQVTEFYTAKDFPVYYNHTALDPASDKQEHQASLLSFLYKFAFDSRALSQGFLVATNDMHGKMKSQASYAEGDEKTPINYTENFYRNTGSKGLAEKFDFVYAAKGGVIEQGNMGIDVELMTDTREFSVKSSSLEMQGQMDWVSVLPPVWIPTIWPVVGNSENTYRAVTTTKVITYHSVLDSVVVIDKGSQVSTKNLVYDAETGAVIVNRTNNEFDKPVYTTTYPAWWAYSGMSLAYKNIGAVYSNVKFSDGKLINNNVPMQAIESGDEIYISNSGPNSIQTTNINATISVNCNDVGCTQQGVTSVVFNFANPTPADLKVQIGQINTNNSNTKRATGFDIFTLPSGVIPDTYYAPNESRTFDFVIPKGTTSKTFSGPIYIGSNSNRAWYCHSCLFPTTSLYIKGYDANNLYQTNFTTNQNITVVNVPVNTIDCTIPDSDPNEKLIWAFDKNKNLSSLTNSIPDFIFIDRKGKPYTRNNVSFRIVRSGKRNYLDQSVASIVTMSEPISINAGIRKLLIDNNSAVVNASAVEFKEKWQTDNEIIKRIKSIQVNCSWFEQEYCEGFLEKNINPYRKGLLGNFKSYQSLIFYGNRKEANPLSSTDLKNNGFLDAFSLYWTFDIDKRLVPAGAGGKWVWNSQVTRVNAKSQELETKDALNVFTSAQYGYHKSLPVAITNNSQYYEMFYAGMEDDSFQEELNSIKTSSCKTSHVNIAGTSTNEAHTGKGVLQVLANSNVTNLLPVKSQVVDQFSLQFESDMIKSLFDLGGNLVSLSNSAMVASISSISTGGNTLEVRANHTDSLSVSYGVETSQLLHITQTGVYNIRLNFEASTGSVAGGVGIPSIGATFVLYDKDDNQFQGVVSQSYNSLGGYGEMSRNVVLCPGIYRIVITGDATHTNGPASGGMSVYDRYVIACTNNTISMYKTPNTQNGCNYTKPMAADETMLNPVFSIPAEKKMIFSAWVKENCQTTGGQACNTYSKNEVKLQFNDGSNKTFSLKPSGAIVDGWQKVEGEFSAPAGATQLTLRFVNTSSSASYFDDIRIHPYNANMKSYVYDPVSLRLVAELDANNYATFYEYDEEGTLVRTKAETKEGIKTIKETRSFQQREIKQQL